MSIDRQGNTLNIEFDSSRYQSADIIKQTLSDFEVRDLKMVDTDIEDIIRIAHEHASMPSIPVTDSCPKMRT